MTRNQIRTILIIAIVLYCIGCAVACKEKPKEPTVKIDMPNGDVLVGKYRDIVNVINQKYKIEKISDYQYLAVDTTTDNDWI